MRYQTRFQTLIGKIVSESTTPMIYLLFAIAFAMTGIAAFEFVCLRVTEMTNKKLKRRIAVLERSNGKLEGDMTSLMIQLEAVRNDGEFDTDENWPEVIVDEKRL